MTNNQKQFTATEKIDTLLLMIKSKQNYLGEHVSIVFNDTEIRQLCGINEKEVKWLLKQFEDKGYVKVLGGISDGVMVELTFDGERYIEALKKELDAVN